MNNEKVKEIKYRLKKEYFKLDKEYSDHLAYGGKADKREEKIYFLRDVIECIYDLKSENEKLKQHKRELQGGQQDLIKRIAELEKQMCRNEDLHTATEKFNDIIILKQFAERLKENITVYYPSVIESIDETLKESIKCIKP